MVPPGETFQRGAVILRKHWCMTNARCKAMVWGGREVGREKNNTGHPERGFHLLGRKKTDKGIHFPPTK